MVTEQLSCEQDTALVVRKAKQHIFDLRRLRRDCWSVCATESVLKCWMAGHQMVLKLLEGSLGQSCSMQPSPLSAICSDLYIFSLIPLTQPIASSNWSHQAKASCPLKRGLPAFTHKQSDLFIDPLCNTQMAHDITWTYIDCLNCAIYCIYDLFILYCCGIVLLCNDASTQSRSTALHDPAVESSKCQDRGSIHSRTLNQKVCVTSKTAEWTAGGGFTHSYAWWSTVVSGASDWISCKFCNCS